MKEKIKSKVFLSWVLSYVFILLMPILVGTFVYLHALNTVREEVENVNVAALQQLQSAADANLSEWNRVVGSLSLNQDIRTIISLKKPLKASNMPTVMAVQDELARFLVTDSMLEEIFVYVNNHRYILTSSYKYGEDEIEKVCTRTLGLSYEEFMRLSQTKHYEPFRILRIRQGDGTERLSILYMSPLFSYGFTKPMGMLVVKLNTEHFLSMLTNMELTGHGEVLLINELGEFCSTNPAQTSSPAWSYEALQTAQMTFTAMLDGADTTVAHIQSDVGNVEYVSLIPTAMFLRKVFQIRQLIWGYVIVCLVVGGATAWMFAKRNYGPVERMKKLLVHRLSSAENAKNAGNEFALMEQSLLLLLESESKFRDVMEKQFKAQRDNLLVRILKGRVGQNEDLSAMLAAHKITFEGERFVVASVCIEDVEEESFRAYREDADAYSLICSIVRSVGQDVLGESYAAYMAEIDGMMAFVINVGEAEESRICSDCGQSLQKMIAFVKQSFGIELSVCLSGVQYGLEGIADAYSETLLTQEYRAFVCEKDEVLRFDLLNRSVGEPVYDAFSIANQRMLTNCLTARDYEAAQRLFHQLLAHDVKTISSVQLMKIRAFALVNLAINAVKELEDGACADFLETCNPLEGLLGAKTVRELQEQAERVFGQMIDMLEDPDSRQIPECIREAEHYVSKHFCEPELNVASVAEALGVSTSYLSRTYKRWRGNGLLEHIHIKRLEMAKKELLEGGSLSQVAEHVG